MRFPWLLLADTDLFAEFYHVYYTWDGLAKYDSSNIRLRLLYNRLIMTATRLTTSSAPRSVHASHALQRP